MEQSIIFLFSFRQINDENKKIFPRDSGYNNRKNEAIFESLRKENIKIAIGPISHEDFKILF